MTPPTPNGLVREPLHGAVIGGDPSSIVLRVVGVYEDNTRPLAVQVLADPADLESWETIATTTATTPDPDGFAFEVDAKPVTGDADRARWPAGGVLRLRVVDDAGAELPYDAEVPEDGVIAIINPSAPPAGWTYLLEEAPGSVEETIAYYAAIDAPPTLTDFLTRFGFPENETPAVYYNAGDLAIGREMHCRPQLPAAGLACYVRNYGIFGGDRDEALELLLAAGPPLATVAMVYTPPIDAPNAVTFMVYGPDGALINEAQLDSRGDNTSIPQNCLNCHGGRAAYDPVAHAVNGARFLPFDPSAFAYADTPELSLVAQEERFRRLDRMIANAAPTPGVLELVEGMFPVANTPYDAAFVPPGWSATPRDARVYRDVIAPYCRGCHASFAGAATDVLAFTTADGLKALAGTVAARVCGSGPRGMPAAEATATSFFNSPARGVLLAWLEQPGACAPPATP